MERKIKVSGEFLLTEEKWALGDIDFLSNPLLKLVQIHLNTLLSEFKDDGNAIVFVSTEPPFDLEITFGIEQDSPSVKIPLDKIFEFWEFEDEEDESSIKNRVDFVKKLRKIADSIEKYGK